MTTSTLDPWNPSSGLHAEHPWDTETEYCKILYWLIIAHKLKRILEIGTHQGHSTKWWIEAGKKTKGFVTTVDIEKHVCLNYRDSVHFEQVVCRSDIFWSKARFDFIYIDGGHSYEQAYRDIINAHSHLSEDGCGFIAVHDTGYDDPPLAEVKRATHNAIKVIGGDWMHLSQGKGISIGQFGEF